MKKKKHKLAILIGKCLFLQFSDLDNTGKII